jgi:2-oxoglutarate ferredoxin oxidoreductase subunit beta
MDVVFQRTTGLTEAPFSYCPGCTHGIIHRLVAESLQELGVLERSIAIASVGCSVMSYEYFNCDAIQAPHGRAPAVATGVKRVKPQQIVFTYQGDGDLASIGIGEIVQAAHRGENITVIFVNNAIYGMTGGQMAPTTLAQQVTTTSPLGRNPLESGHPLHVSELLATIEGAHYIERVMVADPPSIRNAKKAIKKAFDHQVHQRGFSLVEVLSSCNIGWGLSATDALQFIKNDMQAIFPLGVKKERPEGSQV